MGKKLGLHINGRRFDVDVEDDFASFLENQMQNDFNFEGNNDIKQLLYAYVRKSYELYGQSIQIKKTLEKIEKEG
ncbi:MAG: hypothetical protein FAF05_07215 [Epsilonproteobacteria bacterium]|nr:hypothetical protein [Campylobacterota bacterium]